MIVNEISYDVIVDADIIAYLHYNYVPGGEVAETHPVIPVTKVEGVT